MINELYNNYYLTDFCKELQKKTELKNRYQLPKLQKIVLNMSSKRVLRNKKISSDLIEQLTLITGQKAKPTYSKKSIAGFGLQKNFPIGASVTLRNKIMYAFLEKLIYYVIPKIRDFQGFKTNSFDGRGNYNFGIKEQIVFSEIDYEKYNFLYGMNVTFVFKSLSDKHSTEYLKLLKFPFKHYNK